MVEPDSDLDLDPVGSVSETEKPVGVSRMELVAVSVGVSLGVRVAVGAGVTVGVAPVALTDIETLVDRVNDFDGEAPERLMDGLDAEMLIDTDGVRNTWQ